MTEFVDGVLEGIIITPLSEWIAVLTSIVYVLLAARKSIWCWPFALASSAIFVYLCLDAKLYIESGLQSFYVVMAVVGWVMWSRDKSDDKIIKWPVNYHLLNILLSGVVVFVLGYTFSQWTDQQNPYTDAFTTVFSLTATFLVARKVLSNWLYWIIIDAVSIYLYASRDLNLSAVLFFIFTLIAIFGWWKWLRLYQKQLN